MRQHGDAYISTRNKLMSAKKLKKPCESTCFYMCTKNFSEDDRSNIFKIFWNMDDNKKNEFYSKFVKRKEIARRRVKDSAKKKNSFFYYFEKNNNYQQVCKTFFLNTLDISDKRIYYHFKHLYDSTVGVAKTLKKGRHTKHITPQETNDKIKNFIKSFPTIDSHYCRSTSSRKYLEQGLSISKMFNLYQEKYPDDTTKFCIFSKIFNNSFNLSFFKPKKDQCDRCLLYKNCKENISQAEQKIYDTHKNENRLLKCERDIDRNNMNNSTLIICFDMQSVFSLPKGFGSSFYYKRKLNVFNLTVTVCMKEKPNLTYCAIWNEAHSGRSGNDIASALIKVLNKILKDFNHTEHIVLWSDSCVPQNRNQIMSTALLQFMFENKNIKSIIQKFSEPGHSQIQEIDAVHSSIDRHLKNKEIHSPLDLIRKIKQINYSKVKLVVLQMMKPDFKMFSSKAASFDFQNIPFKKIKILLYSTEDLFCLKFKTSVADIYFKISSISKKTRKSNLPTPTNIFERHLTVLGSKKLQKDKISDIKSLFKYLPPTDVQYYNCLF